MQNVEEKKIAKQIIILRKDLNMRKGKMIAQGAHASMKVILDLTSNQSPISTAMHKELVLRKMLYMERFSPLERWINGTFTKIVVSVNSEKELLGCYNQAGEACLPCSLIQDMGLTEFKKPTYTAVAIGPAWNDEIDKITGDLKLL